MATVETGVKSGETKLNSSLKARFEWIDGSITAYLPAARAVGEPLESPVGHGSPCAEARVPKPLMSSIVTPFFGNHEQVCGMLFGLKNDPEILIHGDGQTNRHEPRLWIENAALGCYPLNSPFTTPLSISPSRIGSCRQSDGLWLFGVQGFEPKVIQSSDINAQGASLPAKGENWGRKTSGSSRHAGPCRQWRWQWVGVPSSSTATAALGTIATPFQGPPLCSERVRRRPAGRRRRRQVYSVATS